MAQSKNLALHWTSLVGCTYSMQFCPMMVILHQS